MHLEENIPSAVINGTVHGTCRQQRRGNVGGIRNQVAGGIGDATNHLAKTVAKGKQIKDRLDKTAEHNKPGARLERINVAHENRIWATRIKRSAEFASTAFGDCDSRVDTGVDQAHSANLFLNCG